MITAWVNGQPATQVELADRGLAYGDGLFETMQVKRGQVILLDYHLRRLQEGCQRLHLPVDLVRLQQEIGQYAAKLQQGVCKLIVTRGDGQRGYAAPQPTNIRRILQSAALPQWPQEHAQQGVFLYPCQTRLAVQPLLAGLKHLNRLEQVLARAEWHDSTYAEGLMQDTAGRMIEGVFSNIFFVRDGILLTPELSGSGVKGVMRQRLLDLASELGLVAQVAELYPQDLGRMDEVFTCNSLYGIWPVRGYAEHSWPAGPLTRRLQSIINRQNS